MSHGREFYIAAGTHLWSRAEAFHRAVERLFQALRTDGAATGDPRGTWGECRRRWQEVNRAMGREPMNAYADFHLDMAYRLLQRIHHTIPELEARFGTRPLATVIRDLRLSL